MSWLVKTFSNPGDTVLDPFMGVGTTGVACAPDRDFIGIEINPAFCAEAERRLAQAWGADQPGLVGGDEQLRLL